MARAVIPPAFRVAVIDVRVKAETCCVAVLLVSHGAKRHALVFARLFVAQNGVVFLAADFGALKSDERVVFRSVNDHRCNQIVYILCMYMIFFEWDNGMGWDGMEWHGCSFGRTLQIIGRQKPLGLRLLPRDRIYVATQVIVAQHHGVVLDAGRRR